MTEKKEKVPMNISRRTFLKVGAAAIAATACVSNQSSLKGQILVKAGRDISPASKKERKAIATACWQCVARDGMIGYVEDGRLVKLEGNPELPRTNGKLCAKGQAGIGQVYSPDRVLYPMKRVGKRGDGQWKRISWDEALAELTGKLKKLQDDGHPEKFLFHYGRMKGSDSTIVSKYFLPAYGTSTVAGHTSVCEVGKWTAQELTWGKHYDVNDVTHTNFILNFGCNVLETHTSHIPFSQRVVKAVVDRKVPMYTFDVRLSNTAAKSTEWIPVKPGTDGAIGLAMANVVMAEGLFDKEFIETWTNVTVAQLQEHLKQYSPEWAEKVSGVSASKIKDLAKRYAKAKPGTIITYRGAVAHYNGVQNERIFLMLEAICGNIDRQGGRCQAVGASWKSSCRAPEAHPKKLAILDGKKPICPTHHNAQETLQMIRDAKERPEIYLVYCHNPVYVYGNCQENIDILKDESLIPYLVCCDVAYSETSALADLILPDATYLERWCADDMVSYDMIPEYYIRQPLVAPLGEARNFPDVCCEIAQRLGGEVAKAMAFGSAEAFVKDCCNTTAGVKEAGGFEYMKQHGAWYDKTAKPKYKGYAKELKEEDLKDTKEDPATGLIFKGDKYDDKKGSNYVGIRINGKAYAGWKPDRVARSTGKFTIYSEELKKKGCDPMPTYVPIPEHENLGGKLILTTFKVTVQTQSRSQNCKYLTELYHDNPAWINPKTAKECGIADGARIKVTSEISSIVTRAKVTEGIVPGVLAISTSCGHWAHGRYASGVKAPLAHDDDVDLKLKWWKEKGEHPNWLMPNWSEPISGQMRYMDTPVSVVPA